MKKNIVLIFLSFLTFFITSPVFSDGFNSVHSPDGNLVIAVGNNGNVFRSLNGGTSFSSYPLGSVNLNSVHTAFQRIWIVGDNGNYFISTNSGWNFTSYTGLTQNLRSVYFLTEVLGWVVGDNGYVARTTNGGVNWTSQTSTVSTALRSVKFSSSANGVACGDGGKVVYTTNGGANWQQYTTPTTKNLTSIDIKGSTIIATGVDGFIIKYDGSLWSAVDYKIVTKTDVRGVSIIDENTYYTCGGGGFIRKTTGGVHKYQANPMMGPLTSIYFSNANSGWAVASNNNAILRTNNGGTNWQFQNGVTVTHNWVQKQASTNNIGNPFFLHPTNKNAVFILAGSALYVSYNKGDNWVLLNSSVPGPRAHGFVMSRTDTNLMIATKGESNGRVIKSTNYGATWFDLFNPINLTSYGIPIASDPNAPNTLYLGPDNDTLMKTTDFGVTWTNLTGPETGNKFRSPCSIYIHYENPNLVFVGDGTTGIDFGKLWRSTNGGANWSLISTVTGSEVPIVTGTTLDLNLIYHNSWSSGSFWKSTNMGVNFADLSRPGALWATDLPDDDPTAVSYNLYSEGKSYVSLDEGNTFKETGTTFGSAAGMCFMDKSTLLAQYGSGIYKLNVAYNVVTSVENISNEVPDKFDLSQNYPNPFNPSTTIKFNIAKNGLVKIKVFDVRGTAVSELVSSFINAGSYEANFNGKNLTSGIYFYTMSVDGITIDTKKMMLIK